ncbi:MAG: beta-hydroxyacyl-ACP dehydratase [Akkermansiaceae bacterium]|nr:beta-hydroxyacyl-ACP dehydratase [Akkermansiaceae bacterium]
MSSHPELELLPHGPEFRFVQQLSSLEPGVSASGTYEISGDEAFLKGHFPGHPIWPGVVMVEAIAQLGGVVAQSDPAQEKLDDMRLTAIKNAKILGTAEPGATLTISARVEGRMGPLIQVSGSVSDGDNCLAKAVVMLSGSRAGVNA